MKRALAVWLPNWPMQRLLVVQPELAGQAVVLHKRDPRRGELVRACSAQAFEQGIRPGMPLAEAAVLLRDESNNASSEERYFACHDAYLDHEALIRLALDCERFSPLVGLDKGDSPEGLRMDVTGVSDLFGGENSLAQQVLAFFQQHGYQPHVVIANTPSAAEAVARWISGAVEPKILAPDDIQLLKALPVAALRLSEATDRQLEHLGIRQLGQLQNLPRNSLASRLGAEPSKRLDQITGAAGEIIVACRRPVDLSVQRSFEHPITHSEAIALTVEELLRRLSERLSDLGRGVLQLECRLVCQDRNVREIQIGLFQPTVDPGHLSGLLRVQLERLELSEAVQQIQITAASTAPRQQRQAELFADASPGDPAKLALLIERLSNRLGRDSVLQPQLQADAQPERAYRCQPLTGERISSTVSTHAGSAEPLGPMFRPLKLFDPPRPIEMVGIALDGPPGRFFYRRQAYRVANYFGPERIETGWWRGPSSRRDYYRVETDGGQSLWLFRQLQDQRWFLHGEFV